MRVCALALLLCAVLCLHSSAAAALRESELPSEDEYILSWVQHLRVGDVIFAKQPDIEQISAYVATESSRDDGTACFGTESTRETEDGPVIEIGDLEPKKRDKSVPKENSCVKEVKNVYYYPEYAVGLLDNGCTAFLVGPHHAMTLAKCVYNHNQRLWSDNLDFWRGRNDSSYLQRMEWEEVYIPRLFHQEGREKYDWAIISYKKSQSSPVWHSIEYCPDKCPGPYVTSFGYLGRKLTNMFQKECEIPEQDCYKHFNMQCCQSQSATFHGGPVVNGYSFNGLKMPPVVGITSHSKNKLQLAEGEFQTEFAVTFDSDMFWSTCFLLSRSGYDPKCQKS